MVKPVRKIVNDPVHGFITINDALIFDIIGHPYYQRLRRIQQMAMAQLVYPGAVHTRLHHSLGAYHLMCMALNELEDKGIPLSKEEKQAAKIAILLHDIGHGPFSHALEKVLLRGVHHESVSLAIMQNLNNAFNGQLDLAISIFTNHYNRPFLHQLISGQLDVDRMDYLSRDSFFTGVSEGVIGYERILKMVNVVDNTLVVEEKGLNSVEKFLLARRLMYWQVYRHKTVVASENMLVKIIERVQYLFSCGDETVKTKTALDVLLGNFSGNIEDISLDTFCQLDDTDILFAIKQWQNHEDKVLSILCKGILNRKCFSCQMSDKEISDQDWQNAWELARKQFALNDFDLSFLCFKGSTSNTLYNASEETIKILKKSGEITDITAMDNALINESLSAPVKKFYICLMKA